MISQSASWLPTPKTVCGRRYFRVRRLGIEQLDILLIAGQPDVDAHRLQVRASLLFGLEHCES